MGFGLFDSDSGKKKGGSSSGLTPKRQKYLEACARNPGLYFWGTDPETGLHIVRTKDQLDEEDPIKPMPDWPYLAFIVKQWARTDVSKHMVDKPRQLMVSWLLMLWMDYMSIFKPFRRCLLNKATEDEAWFMLEDRLGVIHRFWPEWFREWVEPLEQKAKHQFSYGRTGSSVAATGENVDDRAARGDVASVFGVDEAARHPRLREVVAALMPMSKQVILVSTPEAGTPGSAYFNEILREEL